MQRRLRREDNRESAKTKVRAEGIKLNSFLFFALFCGLYFLSAVVANAQTAAVPKVTGNIVALADGYTFEADEVWKQGDELWYRKGNITQRIPQPVKSVKPILEPPKPEALEAAKT